MGQLYVPPSCRVGSGLCSSQQFGSMACAWEHWRGRGGGVTRRKMVHPLHTTVEQRDRRLLSQLLRISPVSQTLDRLLTLVGRLDERHVVSPLQEHNGKAIGWAEAQGGAGWNPTRTQISRNTYKLASDLPTEQPLSLESIMGRIRI